MLSRLLVVRLKAAEHALRCGRLDEAYRLATAPDLREHRRGAAVLAGLTERFIERARMHFRADRFTEAQMDLDRAETGGVMQVEIAELRQHVQTVAAEQQRRQQSRHERIKVARRRIEDGSLAGGQKILERASATDVDAVRLRRAIDGRAEEADSIVEAAEKLIADGQFVAAAKRLRRARSIDANHEAATRLETRLCDQVLAKARAAITEGKVSRATDELACLGGLGDALPAKRELKNLLAIARSAGRCVQSGRYTEAKRHAMSLGRLLPEAEWIQAAMDQLRQIDEVTAAICAGPLGNPMDRATASRGLQPERKSAQEEACASLDDTVALPALPKAEGRLPDRLLLLVEGGGSYLVLRCPQASIGRVVSSHPADVPIYSDVAERQANITRVEEDYFLFGAKEVEVAGRKTRHQLLRDGDRIVLGRKAKMTFRLPSRKSPTAVLDMSDTTKMPNDVRRVILFNQNAIVGASANAHIRCPHVGTSVVLFERHGELWMRLKNDGHVDTEPVRLPLGEPIEIAGVSLVLKPWEVH